MDSKTTFTDAKKWVAKTIRDRNWHRSPRSIAISICLEAAELLEHFQWEETRENLSPETISPEKKTEIAMEFADVLVYLMDFANTYQLDVADVLREKLHRVDIKYPADKIRNGGEDFYLQQKKAYRQIKK